MPYKPRKELEILFKKRLHMLSLEDVKFMTKILNNCVEYPKLMEGNLATCKSVNQRDLFKPEEK